MRKPGGRKLNTLEGVAEKHTRTDKSNTELDTCTEGGREEVTSHTKDKKMGT